MATEMTAGTPLRAPPLTSALPSKLMAGAEACRAMLASIEALRKLDIRPASESNADTQAAYAGQYAAVDQALSLALDQHGDSPGFRSALGSYLLNVAGGNIPGGEQLTAENLLTDCGYRAFPTEPAEAADESTDSVDFEDDGFRLESLLWLAEWIERARDLTDQIKTVAGSSEDLRRVLRQHDIPTNNASWSDEASAGLNIVTTTAIQLGRGLAAKGMALQRQKGGPSHG